MFNFTTPKVAAIVVAVLSIAAASPASAAMGDRQQQDKYIGDYCTTYPSANQCQDWSTNHSHWTPNQYQSFYRGHQHDVGFGGNVAAGLFGFAAGAVIATALTANNNDNSSSHVAACEQAYHSYNVRTDTYRGYDGFDQQCTL